MTKVAGLSRRERQIMDTLYAQGECSARDIHDSLPDAPSYSSVRALLAVLASKGHVTHRQQGARYIYTPAQPISSARTGAIGRLVKTFFGGSHGEAVNALLGKDGAALTDEELDELQAVVEAARRKRSR